MTKDLFLFFKVSRQKPDPDAHQFRCLYLSISQLRFATILNLLLDPEWAQGLRAPFISASYQKPN
jgi:hypothetical protein